MLKKKGSIWIIGLLLMFFVLTLPQSVYAAGPLGAEEIRRVISKEDYPCTWGEYTYPQIVTATSSSNPEVAEAYIDKYDPKVICIANKECTPVVGTTIITVTYGGITKKTRFTVEKYKNPFKSLKICGTELKSVF